ncbi:MAG: transposase [Candidatus Binatia bacterium]
MALKRRKFTREFKLQIIREVEAGKALAQVAREYEVHPTQLRRWGQVQQQYGGRAFAGNGRAYREEARVAELERMIGQLTMENALLKKALRRLEERGGDLPRSGGRR